MKYSMNELKPGVKILINNEPYSILNCDFVKPGKGQAFTTIKIRNLKTNRIIERNIKNGESVESADVFEIDIQYLYFDGSSYVFMTTDGSCEQYELNKELLGDIVLWLKEEVIYSAVLWDNVVINAGVPSKIDLEVVEAEPGVKGDTASGGTKNVVLITGASIRAPLFINIGDIVKVNPQTSEYLGRV